MDQPEKSRVVRPLTSLVACLVALIAPRQTTHLLADEPATPPLRTLIDQQIAEGCAKRGATPAGRSTDAEFLRRITLDLTGTIPSTDQARAFLEDSLPTKREALIDRLLGSPEYARHLEQVFDVMLIERRQDKHIPSSDWQNYLRRSFAENKPWDHLAREILAANPDDPKLRAAAGFYLDREGELTVVTRDVARIFLGMNLECSQCHNHPIVSDYVQEYYYGLYAFLNRSYVFTDKKQNNQVVFAERAEGDVTFKSVFEPEKGEMKTGPRLPEGPAIEEPAIEKGKEYDVPPADGVRPVPKYSRRAQLATYLPTASDTPFKRNIANRLWARMIGRGLVEPLDFDHSENPPSHPELLELLGNRFAEMKFDIKAFLRELALTDAYQRSGVLPDGQPEPPPEAFAVAAIKPLSPEQLGTSVMLATGWTDIQRRELGDKCNEETLYDRRAAGLTKFVSAFAGFPGQPEGKFQATSQQALFLSNGSLIAGWLEPKSGNLVDRLLKCPDADAIARELNLSVLTRLPSDEERVDVAEYLKDRGADRSAALQELAWALLASAEFRFNH